MKIRCKGCGNIFEIKDKNVKIVKCPECGVAYNNPAYKEIKEEETQDLKNNINEVDNKSENQNIEDKKEIAKTEKQIQVQEEDVSDNPIFELEEEIKEEDLNFSDNEFVGICSKCSRAVYGKNFGELNEKLICKTCYEKQKTYNKKFIGICYNCGKTVYGINCGCESPKVLCQDCLSKYYSKDVKVNNKIDNKIKKETKGEKENTFNFSNLRNIDKKKVSIIISSVLVFIIAFSLLFAFAIPININKNKVPDILQKAEVLGIDEDIYFVSTTKIGNEESNSIISMKKDGNFWKKVSSVRISFSPYFEYYDSKDRIAYMGYSNSYLGKYKSEITESELQTERKNIYKDISTVKTEIKDYAKLIPYKSYKKGGVITIIFMEDDTTITIQIKNNKIIKYSAKLEVDGGTYEETITIKNKYVEAKFNKSDYVNLD